MAIAKTPSLKASVRDVGDSRRSRPSEVGPVAGSLVMVGC